MELKLIQRLVRLMQQGEITDLEIDDSKAGLRLRLQRGPKNTAALSPVVHVTQGGAVPAAPALLAAPAQAVAATAAAAPAPAGPPPGTKEFKSPMVGTFYRAASPDAEPFTSVGKVVKPESVLCIIEAMKVMNEIKAECSGAIVEILVENGAAVEFGQPLFLIKTA